MLFEQTDYRTYLKATLAERAQSQTGYSLRGFSQKIGVSNSFLSEILSRKKSLSMDLAFRIAIKLDLSETETQYFCLLVQLDQEKDPDFREGLLLRLNRLNPTRQSYDLSADVFRTIADWSHLAILELSQLSGFSMEPAEIAKKLGITKVEAELALDRLIRLELLEKRGGWFHKTHSRLLSESKVPSAAFRRFHEQILSQVGEALATQAPQERISATDVVAIDSRLLPEVDQLSRSFSDGLLKIAEKSRTKDHVYALSTHLVRLTKKEGN